MGLNGIQGYIHKMVNHTENFVDPNDRSVHTNKIEGTWFHVKRWLPKHGTRKKLLSNYFAVSSLLK